MVCQMATYWGSGPKHLSLDVNDSADRQLARVALAHQIV